MEDTTSIRARLWKYTAVDPDTGCWCWTGTLDPKGYGKIGINGTTHAVHRLGKLLFGAPFDESLTLDHLCRNRACWNPAHLDPCSMRENILRGTGATAENARKTHCVHGHELTPDNIRHRPGSRSHHRECLTCHRERAAAAKRRGLAA